MLSRQGATLLTKWVGLRVLLTKWAGLRLGLTKWAGLRSLTKWAGLRLLTKLVGLRVGIHPAMMVVHIRLDFVQAELSLPLLVLNFDIICGGSSNTMLSLTSMVEAAATSWASKVSCSDVTPVRLV